LTIKTADILSIAGVRESRRQRRDQEQQGGCKGDSKNSSYKIAFCF
jgi:hypothetical protein